MHVQKSTCVMLMLHYSDKRHTHTAGQASILAIYLTAKYVHENTGPMLVNEVSDKCSLCNPSQTSLPTS